MRKELTIITAYSFYGTTLYHVLNYSNPMFRIRIFPGFISLSGSIGATQAGLKKKNTSSSSRAHLFTVRERWVCFLCFFLKKKKMLWGRGWKHIWKLKQHQWLIPCPSKKILLRIVEVCTRKVCIFLKK